jgi:ABC-type dipeptide/oligopeptide/nickel transport system ATPase component
MAAGSDPEPILQVRDLRVTFGSFTAVDDLSFDLFPGETLAVVGESGSGKSVTALSIMRLVELGTRGKIENGEILFRRPDGEVVDLVQLDEAAMRDIRGNRISMIFQEPLTSLNPVYTVGNQVAEAVVLHQQVDKDEAMARALEMFRLVRIPDPEQRLEQFPHEMSGGMRQRVMIAMALSCDPSVLIADEPTTALDVTIQAQILGLMRDLRQTTGAAVMIITHDMGVVAEVADRVVVMNRSRLVEQGGVFDVFENPVEEYTKALLAAVPRLGSMAGTEGPEAFHLVETAETAEGAEA